jgi:hypothetical protein
MKEVFSSDGLPQMIATSDVVIEGTVQKVEPGRVVGRGDGAIQFGQVTMPVDRVLFGELEPSSVVLEEYGLEYGHLSRVGDHGVYFLTQKDDGPRFFRIVSSQGRFLDDGSGGLVAPNDEADWVKAIEGESLAELENDVEAAAGAVAQGRVEPTQRTL